MNVGDIFTNRKGYTIKIVEVFSGDTAFPYMGVWVNGFEGTRDQSLYRFSATGKAMVVKAKKNHPLDLVL